MDEAIRILTENKYDPLKLNKVTIIVTLLRINTPEAIEVAQSLAGVRIKWLGRCAANPCDFTMSDYLRRL